MERFKYIKEESYESLQKYLEVICALTEIDHPLAFVDLDDNRYLIMKVDRYDRPVDDGYLIMYDNGEEIVPLGTFYKGNEFLLNTGDMAYKIGDNIALIENQKTLYKQQLVCRETVGTIVKNNFTYHQLDPLNKRDVNIHYIFSNNPDYVLPYLKNRIPDAVDIKTQVAFLQLIKKYVLIQGEEYYRYARLNNDTIFALELLKHYSPKEMNELIQSMGFYTTIPDEMIQLFNGQHEQVKTMKRVTDIYRENTKL